MARRREPKPRWHQPGNPHRLCSALSKESPGASKLGVDGSPCGFRLAVGNAGDLLRRRDRAWETTFTWAIRERRLQPQMQVVCEPGTPGFQAEPTRQKDILAS